VVLSALFDSAVITFNAFAVACQKRAEIATFRFAQTSTSVGIITTVSPFVCRNQFSPERRLRFSSSSALSLTGNSRRLFTSRSCTLLLSGALRPPKWSVSSSLPEDALCVRADTSDASSAPPPPAPPPRLVGCRVSPSLRHQPLLLLTMSLTVWVPRTPDVSTWSPEPTPPGKMRITVA